MKLLIACCSTLVILEAQEAPRWQVHGQATTVTQVHGAFESPYQGSQSLHPERETATSFTGTLMLGIRTWNGGEFYLDAEGAAGKGVSSVLGMAGAPNGETYRVGNPEFRATIARIWLRQTWSLGGDTQKTEDDAHQLEGKQSSRRVVVHIGKLSVMDIFDSNSYAHDPRTQFLNWALMGHGAWDYPADTRGYTWGVAADLTWDAWTFRAGRFAEPIVANQMEMDHVMHRSHGDVLEIERRSEILGQPGSLRIMGYRNRARMGSYRQSLALQPQAPDITTTEVEGATKHGWGLNLDQALTSELGAFARVSWSDGRTETWAFTEIDRSVSLGLSLKGSAWARPTDRLGLAFLQNGLSPDHRDYLAAGGLGFIIGDGRLSYAPERIAEAYYALAAGRHVTASVDIQRCWNPAYNHDRGPVTLAALRLHLAY